MSRRSDAGSNRNLRPKKLSRLYIKEEFELDKPSPSRPSMRWLFSLLPIAVFCSSLVLAIAVTVQDSRPKSSVPDMTKSEAFRWAVNRAMSAAELTQIAQSREEWTTVADWWQEAVEFMEAVPRTHPKYDVAQQKVEEYQNNLSYAMGKADTQAADASPNLWSLGSRRIDLIRTQGEPTHTTRYDALCQEVLNYGGSTVELNNGIIVGYEDIDRNLRAIAGDEPVSTALVGDGYSWTIGSTRSDVFAIQGTPDRVTRYDSLRRETLYYGNSTIDLVEDKVAGYNNLGNNLRVAIATIPSGSEDEAVGFWTIGTERNDVFRIQGTPTQVNLENSLCKEILHYGNSVIELRNGFVSGYNNLSGNLQVRVR
ncbi:hypothetical protein [Egbenema bharatensis]|uniref:hypothetical protein n=1 Tax=Egbenema bharatensis TaxID=3463334 RepID=UPI003A88AA75